MKSQVRLRLRVPEEPVAVMVKVAGASFRCQCGANVFTKLRDVRHGEAFVCNGCREMYQVGHCPDGPVRR